MESDPKTMRQERCTDRQHCWYLHLGGLGEGAEPVLLWNSRQRDGEMGGSEVLNQNVLRTSGLDAWVTARNKECCHSFQPVVSRDLFVERR